MKILATLLVLLVCRPCLSGAEEDIDGAPPKIRKIEGTATVTFETNKNFGGWLSSWETIEKWTQRFTNDHNVKTYVRYKFWNDMAKSWAPEYIRVTDFWRQYPGDDVMISTNGYEYIVTHYNKILCVTTGSTNYLNAGIGDVEFPGNEGTITLERKTLTSHTKEIWSVDCIFEIDNSSGTNYFVVDFYYTSHPKQSTNCQYKVRAKIRPYSVKRYVPPVKGCKRVTYGILQKITPVPITKEQFDSIEED